jgi:hypothetical protein
MKKTIRLTEKDLTRIVKRIISEEGEDTQYDMSFGHGTQEKEDVAVKILQMMPNIQEQQEEIVQLLYKSGIMSYPEAKQIKDEYDDINYKIAQATMLLPND